MTPLVVVALLILGFLAGWVGRSVRAAGRQWQLIQESQAWATEAVKAWAYADEIERGADQRFDEAVAEADADGFDRGFQNAAGIQVDIGGIDP